MAKCGYGSCVSTYLLKTCAKCGGEFCYHHYDVIDGEVVCVNCQNKNKKKGTTMQYNRGLSALIALVGIAIVIFFGFQTANAQTPEVELITDPEILQMIMEGQTPEMTVASTEAIDRFWMRTLWDIQDPKEVWVAMTSEPDDSVDLLTYINGELVAEQLFTNASFQQWEYPRNLAETTHSITAQGQHGWVNTQLDWPYCGNSEDGPTFSVVQTEDTWLAIGNRTNESFWFIAPGQDWRELLPGETIGFRIHSLGYGDVVVRRYTPGPNCGMLAWDFDGGSSPIPPWPFELRTLAVTLPTGLVVDTNSTFTVTMSLSGVQGDKRAIGGNLWFSDTLRFISANVVGTTAEHFAENFLAYDAGGYVAFSGFNNAIPVTQNGGVINFVFMATYHAAEAGLVLTDFKFGPEESQVVQANGQVIIKDILTISGHVESFTGVRDVETGFVHRGPDGYHYNNYVSSDASFAIHNVQPGDHWLYFYSMNTDADFNSVSLTDVTWGHVCQLDMLDEQDCPDWVFDSYDQDPYDDIDVLDIYDVLFCSSFVLDIQEQDSKAGWHEYKPYPLEFLPLTSDQHVVVKSAVICDIGGSRWAAQAASTEQQASTVVTGQDGQFEVTVSGSQFFGALVELDLHGGTIVSARFGNEELAHNNGKFIVLSDTPVDQMTVKITTEGTNQVSVISSEVNGWLPPLRDNPQSVNWNIYLPTVAR